MKLNRIQITNFLRIREAELDLAGAKVHLFGGSNEAGKSSVAESVLFALTGETTRVGLKKHYPQLVNQGQKKGSVSIQFDATQITRDVASGKTTDETGFSEVQAHCLRIALGAQLFVSLKPDERRRVLLDLTQITMDVETIVPRLKEKGVADSIVARVKPLLQASVEAAHKSAVDEVRRLRGLWEQQTGETYGSQKAIDWAPKFAGPRPVPTSEGDLARMREQLTAIEQQYTAAQQEVGRISGQVSQRLELIKRQDTIKMLQHNLPVLRRDLESFKRQLEETTEQVEIEDQLLARAELASQTRVCPECATALRIDPETNELEPVSQEDLNFASDGNLAERRKAQAERKVKRQRIETEVRDLTTKVAAATQASMFLEQIDAQLAAIKPEGAEEAGNTAAKLSAAVNQARANVSAAAEANRIIEHNAKVKQAAGHLHEQIAAWAVAADALAPSGIPGELLAEALEDVNRRLMASARLAGWQAPEIGTDMEVVREDGLAYGLLSESAQWRISALVADAIAHMAGMRVLMLDRMDVLDLLGRSQCLEWARKLGEDSYDAVMLFATLKEPMKKIPLGVRVYWLDKGTVAFQQDATEEAA